jgi:hypothetical protein
MSLEGANRLLGNVLLRLSEADDMEKRVSRGVLRERVKLYVQELGVSGRTPTWMVDGLTREERKSLSKHLPKFRYIRGAGGDPGTMGTNDKGTAMKLARELGMEYEKVD